ncbi:MAG: 30S ribosomal protein S6 [Acidimicrobiales bacterium]
MRPYEVMVILEANLEEDVIRGTLTRATELITARGGSPGQVDRWGKRRLAYDIGHRGEGYYALVEASASPAAMAELDRMLTLADEVIRHKVIRLPDRVAGRPRRPAVADGDGQPTRATNAIGA